MNNNFNKFKQKLMIEHLVKSILFGVAVGLGGAGLSLAIFGLAGIDFITWVHILIGAVLTTATFGLLFIFKKPDDKKIAARLDKDMHLQEKISTMVEFQDKDSLLINKQRADAHEKLALKNPKQVPFKLAVLNLPTLLIAGSFFITSFFTPQIAIATGMVKDPTKTDISDDGLTDKTGELIDHIKEDVDKSNVDDEFKDNLKEILDELEKNLEGIDDLAERADTIADAQEQVNEALDKANSKEEIGEALENAENQNLQNLGEAIKNGDEETVNEALKELEKEMANKEGQEKADFMKEIAKEIEDALEESEIPEGDALRDSLQQLADELQQEAQDLENALEQAGDNQEAQDQANQNAQQAAQGSLNQAAGNINKALDQQKKNEELAEQVKQEMEDIWNPEAEDNWQEEDDENSSQDPGEDGQDDQNNQDNQDNQDGQQGGQQGNQGGSTSKTGGKGQSGDKAGFGDGDTKYAGNDHVFTDQGDTQYGDVINDYNQDASEDAAKVGDNSGDISDYFDYLYGTRP